MMIIYIQSEAKSTSIKIVCANVTDYASVVRVHQMMRFTSLLVENVKCSMLVKHISYCLCV